MRDFGGIKYAFKLLVFPDARLFQCANSESKLAWMEAFEGAKRNRQKQHDEIALKRSDTIKQREAKSNRNKNLFPTMGHSTESSNNPFYENERNSEAVILIKIHCYGETSLAYHKGQPTANPCGG